MCCSFLILHTVFLLDAKAQSVPFQINRAGLNPAGKIELTFPSSPTNYYVLYRGSSVQAITAPANLVLGQVSAGVLADRNPPTSVCFFQMRQVSTNSPLDLDLDGIDDLYELMLPGILDPLNPADAAADSDGDQFSNAQEYLTGTDPLGAELTAYVVDNPNPQSGVEFREVSQAIEFLNASVAGTNQGRLVIATDRALAVSRLDLTAEIIFDVAEPYKGKAKLTGPGMGALVINAPGYFGLNGIIIENAGGLNLNSGSHLRLRGNTFPATAVRIGSATLRAAGGGRLSAQSSGLGSFFSDNKFSQYFTFQQYTEAGSASSIRFFDNTAPQMTAEFFGTVGASLEFKANIFKDFELRFQALADATVSVIGQQAMDRLGVTGFVSGNPEIKFENNLALSTTLDFKGPGQLYAYVTAHEAQTFNLNLGTGSAMVQNDHLRVHGDLFLKLRDGEASVGRVDMKNNSMEIGGGYSVNMLDSANATLDMSFGVASANRFEGLLQGSARFQLSENTSIRAGFSAEIYKGITELRSAGASLLGGIFLEYKGLEAGFSGVFEAGEIGGDVTLDAPQGAGMLMLKLDGCNFLGGGTLGCWGPEEEGGRLRAAAQQPSQEIILTGIQNAPAEIDIFDLDASVTIEKCQFSVAGTDIQIVNPGPVTVRQVTVSNGELSIHDDAEEIEVTVEYVTLSEGDISVTAGNGSINNCTINNGQLRAEFGSSGVIRENQVRGEMGTALDVDGGTIEIAENNITGTVSLGSAANTSTITAGQNSFSGVLSVEGGRVTANNNTYQEAIFISRPGILILNGGDLRGIQIMDFNSSGGLARDPVLLGANPDEVITYVDFDGDGCGDYPPPQSVPGIGCVRPGVAPPQ